MGEGNGDLRHFPFLVLLQVIFRSLVLYVFTRKSRTALNHFRNMVAFIFVVDFNLQGFTKLVGFFVFLSWCQLIIARNGILMLVLL